VLAALLAAGTLWAQDAAADPWVRVVVLHTNDQHGSLLPRTPAQAEVDAQGPVGGVAALAAFVRSERERAKASGAHLLLLDAGDQWRGTPEGDLTRGDLVVESMSRLGYDAMALGNHELDFGAENAARLARMASYPWLSSNTTLEATGAPPDWLKTHVVKDLGGVRVAIVGLTTTETERVVVGGGAMGLKFASEVGAARRAAQDLAGQCDLLVFLTHCGTETDAAVLKAVPQASLVVGGHTHTRLGRPVDARGDGTGWVVQAGALCVLAGRVELRVHRETKKVELLDARLVPLDTTKVGVCADTESFLKGRIDAIAELKGLSEQVTTLAAPLWRTGPTPDATSPAGDALCDAIREAIGADVAFQNRGGIRVSLPAGPVTKRDLFVLMPFDNTIVEVPMTGRQLKDALETSLGKDRVTPLEVSGIHARFRVSGEGREERLTWWVFEVGGQPVDDDRVYRVATNSYLAQGGDGYSQFARPGMKDHGTLVRDAVHAFFGKSPTYAPAAQPRVAREDG
jgi:2',3'-cyclic-nucleotide 2'-phosphodiesterase (5'-nucleotidase family)